MATQRSYVCTSYVGSRSFYRLVDVGLMYPLLLASISSSHAEQKDSFYNAFVPGSGTLNYCWP
jgi:hypothetical protein